MEDEKYVALKEVLLRMLKDFEKIKKSSEQASAMAQQIGGPLQKEISAFSTKLDRLMHELLKLEQETRSL
ncbi:MAG TPA: hypothetical protein VJL87_03500 [Bdellovibrionota bacterium]|nr:hypothetical protein [Bdellovibrionota bacterium]